VRSRAQVLTGTSVAALQDADGKVALRLGDGRQLTADRVVLLFGYQPNTTAPWLAGLGLETGPAGYLVVDGNQETSCPGVFAIGDVANPAHPCVATALASGTMAARAIQQRLGP
jgi:thioredoxin reductase